MATVFAWCIIAIVKTIFTITFFYLKVETFYLQNLIAYMLKKCIQLHLDPTTYHEM